MPTEQDVTYRVNLDTSQLDSQLNDIRSKIDNVIGAYSPQAQLGGSVSSPNFVPAGNSTTDILASGWDKLTSPFQGLGTPQLTSNVIPPPSFGFDSGVAFRGMSGPEGFEAIRNRAESAGFFSRMGTSLGLGWNPTMPLSAADYQRMASAEISPDAAGKMVAGLGGLGLGTLAGAITTAAIPIPGLNIAAGIAADFVVSDIAQPALEWLFTDPEKQLEFQRGQYFSRESRVGRQIGLTRPQGESAAKEISQFMDSTTRYIQDYTQGEMDDMLKSFDVSGGFTGVTNAQQYSERVKTFIDNHREVMHILRMSSEEASSFLGEINNLGLSNGTNALGIAGQVRGLAAVTGGTPQEIVNTIIQGEQFARGTGLYMPQAGMDLAQMNANIIGMQATGALSPELIRQAGGPEALANTMFQGGYNYAQSPAGRMMLAAAGGVGGDISKLFDMNINQIAGMASQTFTQGNFMANALTFQANAEKMASLYGPDIMNLLQAKPTLDIAEIALGHKLNENETIGALRSQFGLVGAQTMAGILFEAPEDREARIQKMQSIAANSILDQNPTRIQTLLGEAEHEIATYFKARGRVFSDFGRNAYVNLGIERTIEDFTEWNTSNVNIAKERGLVDMQYNPDLSQVSTRSETLAEEVENLNGKVRGGIQTVDPGPHASFDARIEYDRELKASLYTIGDVDRVKQLRDDFRLNKTKLEKNIRSSIINLKGWSEMSVLSKDNHPKEIAELLLAHPEGDERTAAFAHYAQTFEDIPESDTEYLRMISEGVNPKGFETVARLGQVLNKIDPLQTTQGLTANQVKAHEATTKFDNFATKAIQSMSDHLTGVKSEATPVGSNLSTNSDINQAMRTLIDKIDQLIRTMRPGQYGAMGT